jgi:hypothetical protein
MCFAETVSDGSSNEQAGPGGGLVGGVAGVGSFSSDHMRAGGFDDLDDLLGCIALYYGTFKMSMIVYMALHDYYI